MKRLLVIMFLIMLIISILQIKFLYALYKDELSGLYENSIGSWIIIVDGNTLTTNLNNTTTYNISNEYLKYDESTIVKDGKIAPGMSGYFDLIIDATDSDVSIVYEINIKTDTIENASIEITSIENYFVNLNETKVSDNINITTNDTVHKGIFSIANINAKLKNVIRVHFIWRDYEKNNNKDTSLGSTKNSSIQIPVETNFKQYTGEEL